MIKKSIVSNSDCIEEEWTPSAIDCFEIKCNCKRCFLYHVYFKYSPDKCKMYQAVKRLIRKVGIPVKYEKEAYSETKNKAAGHKKLRSGSVDAGAV